MDKIYQDHAAALRQALKETNWWQIVQDEVKEQLDFVLNNFELLGPPFRVAFISAFKYENIHRVLSKQVSKVNHPSALFGPAMSEECYQSGKEPLRMLLHLHDWTEPNEADVQACIMICNQIEKIEMLNDTPNIFDDLLNQVASEDSD